MFLPISRLFAKHERLYVVDLCLYSVIARDERGYLVARVHDGGVLAPEIVADSRKRQRHHVVHEIYGDLTRHDDFFVLALAALFWTLAKRKKQKAVPLTEEQRKRAEALLKGQINKKGDH